MSKEKIPFIFLDFDGTITDKKGNVSCKAVALLRGFENKMCRVIVTGRTINSFCNKVEKDFPIDYLIFSTGAGIMDWHKKEIIDFTVFNQEQTKLIETKLKEMKLSFSVHHPIPENHRFQYFKGDEFADDFGRYLKIAKSFGEKWDNSIIRSTQFLIITDDKDFALNRFGYIRKFANIFKISSPIDHKTTWIEILPKKVSKSFGAEKLIRICNMEPAITYAIGNDFNDEDLIKWANEGYFVDTADKVLSGKYSILENKNNNGVADFLEKIKDSEILFLNNCCN